jgi:hypothetical protein
MLADVNSNTAQLSKASIVEWVNSSIEPCQSFVCVKDIPSRVAAAFMNDIFGDRAFPMRGVNFSACDDFAVNKRNCDAVLQGANSLGFQATFTGHSWANGVKDFGGVLQFWRWLRHKSLEKPLSRVMPASELGLSCATGGAAAAAASAGLAADGANRVIRLSAVTSAAIANGVGPSENAAPTGAPGAASAAAAAAGPGGASNVFICGGQNGEIAKKLFEANYKELMQMRAVHDQLVQAVNEGDLDRIVLVLQQCHQGM